MILLIIPNNIALIILLTVLVIFLFLTIFTFNVKYNNIISRKNDIINTLKTSIKELDSYNKLLSSYINTQYVLNNNSNTVNNVKNVKKNNYKEFDLDDILIEISKNGISKLDPDKLEYLKKFKK